MEEHALPDATTAAMMILGGLYLQQCSVLRCKDKLYEAELPGFDVAGEETLCKLQFKQHQILHVFVVCVRVAHRRMSWMKQSCLALMPTCRRCGAPTWPMTNSS
eukprot:scaffold117066_cov20-Tisochrysis_lutea.AAC.2